MTKAKNFIPRNDQEFAAWLKSFIRYVGGKCAGPAPQWSHIPKDDQERLEESYGNFFNTLGMVGQTHSTIDMKEKNRQRKATEKVVRGFIKAYIRYHPAVTNEDRDALGVPNDDEVRTHHDVVHEDVEFNLEAGGNGRVTAHFKVRGAEGKAKPEGYMGAVIVWDVLDKPPAGPHELTRHDLASKTPYMMSFQEHERGKRLYVAMCWQNGKSIKGAYSEIQSTIIP
jgi:hypothetical protein